MTLDAGAGSGDRNLTEAHRDGTRRRLGKSLSVVQKLQARGYLHPVAKNGSSLFALHEVEPLARVACIAMAGARTVAPGRRPSPWLAGAVKSRGTPAKAARTRRSEGQKAAHVFRLLEQGMSLRQIVIHARVEPHLVRSLHREWKRSLEEGPPPDAHALGDGPELNVLAAAADQHFAHKR